MKRRISATAMLFVGGFVMIVAAGSASAQSQRQEFAADRVLTIAEPGTSARGQVSDRPVHRSLTASSGTTRGARAEVQRIEVVATAPVGLESRDASWNDRSSALVDDRLTTRPTPGGWSGILATLGLLMFFIFRRTTGAF